MTLKSINKYYSLASLYHSLQGYLDNGYVIICDYKTEFEIFVKLKNKKGNIITFYFNLREYLGTEKCFEE